MGVRVFAILELRFNTIQQTFMYVLKNINQILILQSKLQLETSYLKTNTQIIYLTLLMRL